MFLQNRAFALSGRAAGVSLTQGVALGYGLFAPSGRLRNIFPVCLLVTCLLSFSPAGAQGLKDAVGKYGLFTLCSCCLNSLKTETMKITAFLVHPALNHKANT